MNLPPLPVPCRTLSLHWLTTYIIAKVQHLTNQVIASGSHKSVTRVVTTHGDGLREVFGIYRVCWVLPGLLEYFYYVLKKWWECEIMLSHFYVVPFANHAAAPWGWVKWPVILLRLVNFWHSFFPGQMMAVKKQWWCSKWFKFFCPILIPFAQLHWQSVFQSSPEQKD